MVAKVYLGLAIIREARSRARFQNGQLGVLEGSTVLQWEVGAKFSGTHGNAARFMIASFSQLLEHANWSHSSTKEPAKMQVVEITSELAFLSILMAGLLEDFAPLKPMAVPGQNPHLATGCRPMSSFQL